MNICQHCEAYGFDHTWESICDTSDIPKRVNYLDDEYSKFIKDKRLPY